MSRRTIKMLFIPIDADQPVEIKDVEDDWRAWKELVGGWTTGWWPVPDDKLFVLCDEEGLPKGLKPNLRAHKILRVPVVGNVLVAGYENEQVQDFPYTLEEVMQ